MCGVKLNRIWLVLLSLSLLFLVSGNLLADSETEDREYLLNECGNRLETTTNELERSLNREQKWRAWSVDALSLSNDLLTERREDAERFRTIDRSLIELEADHRTELRRTRWSARLEGAGVGALIALIVTLFI